MSLEDYLSKRTRQYVRELMSRAFSTNQPKNPDIIQFTNPERTKGLASDGREVNVTIHGSPSKAGQGYLADPSGMHYVVQGADPDHAGIDGVTVDAFAIYGTTTFGPVAYTFSLQKNDLSTLYTLAPESFTTNSSNVRAFFSASGKHIGFIKLTMTPDSQPGSSLLVNWEIISNFGISGSSVSGTRSSGTYSIVNTDFLPEPTMPTNLGGGAGWTSTGPPSIYSIEMTFSNVTIGETMRGSNPFAAMTSSRSIDIVSIFTCTARNRQQFTNGSSFLTPDLTHTYKGRFEIIGVNTDSPTVTTILDRTINTDVTSWDVVGFNTTTVVDPDPASLGSIIQPYFFYRGSDDTKSSAYAVGAGLSPPPVDIWWDHAGSYISDMDSLDFQSETAFPLTTDTYYSTDLSPFGLSNATFPFNGDRVADKLKPVKTGKYLKYEMSTGVLTRYTLNGITYSEKEFSLYPRSSSLSLFPTDWTVA